MSNLIVARESVSSGLYATHTEQSNKSVEITARPPESQVVVENAKSYTGFLGIDAFLNGIARIAQVALDALAKVVASIAGLFIGKTIENATTVTSDNKADESSPTISQPRDVAVDVVVPREGQAVIAEPEASLTDKPAANPYLNSRIAKCAALAGLGAVALYGASYLPVVGPVLCGIPSSLASYLPSFAVESAIAAQQPMCSLTDPLACTLNDVTSAFKAFAVSVPLGLC